MREALLFESSENREGYLLESSENREGYLLESSEYPDGNNATGATLLAAAVEDALLDTDADAAAAALRNDEYNT